MQAQEQLQTIAQAHPYPLVFATLSGAHLYGFPSPDSDYDLRGVHVLPLRMVVGLESGQETVESARLEAGLELDLVTHDVAKFFRLLLKKNGYVLEQVFSPLVVQASPEFEELKALAQGCVTKYHCYHYLGFAASQWRLFLKQAEAPQVKPLLYVYRVLLTGIHLMRTGKVQANLVELNRDFRLPYLNDLIALKTQGEEHAVLPAADFEFHEQAYTRLRAVLAESAANSLLPTVPSAKAGLNDLLVRLRLKGLRD